MPYKSVKELPASTKDMPAHAKRIFMAAFNSAAKSYDDESRQFAVAFAAVKKLYEQDKEGKWHRIKESEPDVILDAAAQAWVDATVAALTAVDPVPLTEQYDMPEPVRQHHEECYKEAIYSALNLLGRRELEMTSGERDALTSLINRLVPKIGAAQEMEESVRYDTIQEAIEAIKVEDALQEAGQRHKDSDYQEFDTVLDILKRLRGQSPKEIQAEQQKQAEEAQANDPQQQMLQGYHGEPAETVSITESYIDGEPLALHETMTILQESGADGREWKVAIIEAGISKNDRLYSLDVLRKAAPLFEGARCYAYDRTLKGKPVFDHLSDEEYRVNPKGYSRDLIGVLTQPMIEGSRLVGTLRLLPSADWLRNNLRYLAEKGYVFPYGLSIDSSGDAHHTESGGKQVLHVDAIRQVNSVDLVTHAAAGGQFLRIVASVAIAQAEREREAEQTQMALIEGLRRDLRRMTVEMTIKEALDDLPGTTAEKRAVSSRILAVIPEGNRS